MTVVIVLVKRLEGVWRTRREDSREDVGCVVDELPCVHVDSGLCAWLG